MKKINISQRDKEQLSINLVMGKNDDPMITTEQGKTEILFYPKRLVFHISRERKQRGKETSVLTEITIFKVRGKPYLSVFLLGNDTLLYRTQDEQWKEVPREIDVKNDPLPRDALKIPI